MKNLLLAVMLAAAPAAGQGPSVDMLRQGCGFDGSACSTPSFAVDASGGETERYIEETIDGASGLSGDLLRKTREGEGLLLQRTIDESPALSRAFRDAGKNRSWNEHYQDRIVDAATASWSSNMKAGYLKGTAAAYATYKTAPPVIDAVAGAVLWVVGVVYGIGLGLLASALTGHF